MSLKHIYLLLCVLGTLLPFSQFIPWVMEHGLNVPLFVQELFSTRIGAFFGMDVIVSVIVLFVFIFKESEHFTPLQKWSPVIVTLTVGVSLGLPLFLYFRQLHIERANHPIAQ